MPKPVVRLEVVGTDAAGLTKLIEEAFDWQLQDVMEGAVQRHALRLPRGFSLDVDEVELARDDGAFERGTHTIAPTRNGSQVHDTCNYLTIHKRQADHPWLIADDIGNSNNPSLLNRRLDLAAHPNPEWRSPSG